MRTTQAETFRQIFDQIPAPTLLKTKGGWLYNVAAQSLCLSDDHLKDLESCGDGASVWLAHRFYLVSATKVDRELLLTLHRDVFPASAARNIASQMRQRLQSAFGCTSDLSRIDALKHDLRGRDRLAGVNRELYQFLHMAHELDLTGQEDGFIYQPEDIDLAAILRETADEVRELCDHVGVTFTFKPSSSKLLMVADAEKINYLVLSLVSNSLAHLPPSGGEITLRLKQEKERAVITVSDNGEGLPSDFLSHPLWCDPDRRLFGRGLGLGLPLAQRIAAAHGGTVMIPSTKKGSKVQVSLPIHAVDDAYGTVLDSLEGKNTGFSTAKILLSNSLPRGLYYPNPEGDNQ